MQRLLDVFQLIFYLALTAVIIFCGIEAGLAFRSIADSIRQGDIKHDQALKDHPEGLKELENLRRQRIQ